jgi:transcriptional regulator with XRE-family HTH domain
LIELCHGFAYRSSTLADNKVASDASASPPVLRVGHETRRWRQTRGLTLSQVSERSGLNIGYLSQIENDKAMPSLEALAGIAKALDVPPAWLLLDSSTPPRVVRLADRPTTELGCARIAEVDAGTSRDVCVLEVTVDPGHSTGVHAHHGDEHHVILTGRWRMTQGEHSIELGPGDYLAWDPSIPHDVENIGDQPGSMLIVYPRRGGRAATEERVRS